MGLTIFAHLGSGETDRVVTDLVRAGRWDHSGMVYDYDSSLLMNHHRPGQGSGAGGDGEDGPPAQGRNHYPTCLLITKLGFLNLIAELSF